MSVTGQEVGVVEGSRGVSVRILFAVYVFACYAL